MRYKITLLLIIIGGVYESCNAQFIVNRHFLPTYIPHNSIGRINYIVHKAKVVMPGKDTLVGFVGVKNSQSIKFYDNTSMSNPKIISVSDIVYMRLYNADTNLIKGSFTEYYRLISKNKLYRKLISGKINVYDQTLVSNERSNYFNYKDLIYQKGDSLFTSGSFWTSSYKKDMIKVLNEEFGNSYKPRDFDSTLDVLRAIRQKSL